MQDFRHIRAWQRAHALAMRIHREAQAFGKKGHGHLRGQLIRSAESIADTIVEGCGADTNPEFARYLDMSIKSANETEYHLLKARDLVLIDQQTWQYLSDETIEVRKMTHGYRKQILRSARTPTRAAES